MATLDPDTITRVAELGVTVATLVSSLFNRKKLKQVREHQIKTRVNGSGQTEKKPAG